MPSKTRPTVTNLKEDDKVQSARFRATAQELNIGKSAKNFDEAFSGIIPAKLKSQNKP